MGATTFFLLPLYITSDAVKSLISREEPLMSPVGGHLGGVFAGSHADSRLAKQRVARR